MTWVVKVRGYQKYKVFWVLGVLRFLVSREQRSVIQFPLNKYQSIANTNNNTNIYATADINVRDNLRKAGR